MARARSKSKATTSIRQHGPSLPVLLLTVSLVALVSWPWADSQAEVVDVAAAIVGVLAAACSILIVLSQRPIARVSRAGLAWTAFVAWSLVAALASGRAWTAFSGESTSMLGWFMIAALGVIGAASTTCAYALTRLLSRFAWLVVFCESALALAQVASGEAVRAGTLPNSTYFGQAIVLLLPWVLSGEPRDSAAQVLARRVTVLVALVALAAVGSRVALALALAWLLWRVFTREEFAGRTRVAVVSGTLLLVAAAGYVFSRAEILGTASISTLGVRPDLWMLSWRAIAQRPIWGWGPDGFAAGGSAVSTLQLAHLTPLPVIAPGAMDPHNLVVWVAVSTGVVGLLIFAWFAFEVIRVWRRSHAANEDVAAASWAVVSCFVVFLTAPIAVQVLPLFALMVGLSLAVTTSLGAGPGVSVPKWLVVSCAALLFLASATFALNAVTRAGFETASSQRSPAVASAAQSASAVWFPDAHLAYLASLHLGYAALVDSALSSGQQDLVAIGKATVLDSRNSSYPLERVRALRSYGASQEEIEAAFTETFARYPFHPLARAEYGLFLAQTGRYVEAKRQLEIARLGDQAGAEERLRIIQAADDVLGER